jgi:hypothetical protein
VELNNNRNINELVFLIIPGLTETSKIVSGMRQ